MASETLIFMNILPFLIVGLCMGAGSAQAAATRDNTIAAFVADNLAAGKPANHLLGEKSPYLLQHAFNPVQWYAWNEEALARARTEGKPIFLSIGYSTCHWCHVMAHQSFEDQAIADYLNKHFIAIKVDREERPDLDQIYMAATQALTGNGGWPMSVFLTPDLKPFYAGTYFPPTSSQGMPGLIDLLRAIHDAWENDRANLEAAAKRLTDHLRQSAEQPPQALEKDLPAQAMEQFASQYDLKHGGFGLAPKFPRPVLFSFMLRQHMASGDQRARRMSLETLRHMAAGGIRDHIGGGFHRYAVDGQWRVPHFEKMLYDQAQLAVSYIEAYQLSGDRFFADIARTTIDYVLRDLTSAEGGFFSAEDADSPDPDQPGHKREGAYYVWTAAEVEKNLGSKQALVFNYHFGIQTGGNATMDPHGEFKGRNILYQAHGLEATAAALKMKVTEVAAAIDEGRRKLAVARDLRPRPHLDDKIITAWNGLMISALAKGATALNEPRYLKAAERNAVFLADHLYDQQNSTLLRRFRGGEAGLPGLLDDHALLVQGLIDLYEASFNIRWLAWAVDLTGQQMEKFADDGRGGFFETPAGDKSLLLRTKGDYDGAEPAANSIAALNLLRLGRLLDNPAWLERATATMAAFGSRIKSHPSVMPQMLANQLFQQQPPLQVVIAGKAGAEDTKAMLRVLAEGFLPYKTLLLTDGGEGQRYLVRHLPHLAEFKPLKGGATAYVCQGYSCRQPVTDPGKLQGLLAASGDKAGHD